MPSPFPLRIVQFTIKLLLGVLLLLGGLSLVEPRSAEADSKQASTTPSGGILEASERAGGHLLARHVGKSVEQLRQRLQSEPRISAASSFTDKATAETAVIACLSANSGRLRSWLADRDREERLVITFRSPTPVGITLERRSAKALPAKGVRLVLEREPRLSRGWFILTGYPEL